MLCPRTNPIVHDPAPKVSLVVALRLHPESPRVFLILRYLLPVPFIRFRVLFPPQALESSRLPFSLPFLYPAADPYVGVPLPRDDSHPSSPALSHLPRWAAVLLVFPDPRRPLPLSPISPPPPPHPPQPLLSAFPNAAPLYPPRGPIQPPPPPPSYLSPDTFFQLKLPCALNRVSKGWGCGGKALG